MTNRTVAHIKTIHREQQFRVVCLDLFQRTILAFAGILRTKRERDLHINALAAPVAHEIDLFLAHTAYRNLIPPSQELEINDVLQ